MKISDLVGLPVLEQSSGEQIGEVQEVMINMSQALVEAIVVKSSGLFTDSQVLPFSAIYAVNDTAISIADQAELHLLEETNETFADLLDRPLITEAGISVGVVADLWFELDTGIITAYVISDGVVTDLLEGQRTLPFQLSRGFTSSQIILADYAARLL